MTRQPANIESGARSDHGLIFAMRLDGRGGGRLLSWDEVSTVVPELPSILWIHLDDQHSDARSWLYERSGLDPIICQALLAEAPRPRSQVFGEGLMLILRGVNLNAGCEADDMVSLRVWMEPGRIITLRHSRIMAVQDLRDAATAGRGPEDLNTFVLRLMDRLLARMGEVVSQLDDAVDELEEKVIESSASELRGELGRLRRSAIALRRYIAPQRDATARLVTEKIPWMTESTRAQLREYSDRLLRFVEDLDAARERAAVTQEELSSRMAERMNRTMYVISVFTAVFLPLGLLTGLLGINVGGMPGVESRAAFWTVCGLLFVMSIVEFYLLKRKGWF